VQVKNGLFNPTGQVAVVTGGNGGRDRAIALGLADAGSAVAVLGRKNTFQPIAIRPAFMESVRNIEPRQRSMSNTIAPTRKRRSESNVPCCLWAEGDPLNTFYAKDGRPLGIWRQWAPRAQGHATKGGHFFPEENPDDTPVLVKQFLAA
jgi:hypothetical protein